MNEDPLYKSRTAWASAIAIAGTQLDAFKVLPHVLQVGAIAVACAYILARGWQAGCQAIAKAVAAQKKV